jgi:hypothetical protein
VFLAPRQEEGRTFRMRPHKTLFAHWLSSTALCGIAGWITVSISSLFTIGIGLLFAGTIVGLYVGWGQARVFSERVQRWGISKWMSYTVAGFTLGWLFALLLRVILVLLTPSLLLQPIMPLVIFSCGGAILGFAQALRLQDSRDRVWWVATSALGSGASAAFGLAVIDLAIPFDRDAIVFTVPHAIYVLLAGSLSMVFYSLLTAFVLVVLLARQNEILSES